MPAASNDTPDFRNTQQKIAEYEMMMSIFEMSFTAYRWSDYFFTAERMPY